MQDEMSNTIETDGPMETYTETDEYGNVYTRTRQVHTSINEQVR